MFESRSAQAEIKVIDFGLSKKFAQSSTRQLTDQHVMTDGVGTIYTMAPQVLQGVYTSKADLWSVGVSLKRDNEYDFSASLKHSQP